MFSEVINIWENSPKQREDKHNYAKRIHELIFGDKNISGVADIQELLAESIVKQIDVDKKGIWLVLDDDNCGIRIRLDPEDYTSVANWILCLKAYEPNEFSSIQNILEHINKANSNFVSLDIGANSGWYSIYIQKKYAQSSVYSFEPAPKTYSMLLENLNANGISGERAFNVGLFDKEGELDFYYYGDMTGASSLANTQDRHGTDTIKVKVKVLDEWVGEKKLKSIDFIKCDVEGAEYFVFKGGINIIKKFKPVVFSEILRKWSQKFNYHPNDLIQMFSDVGYRCFVPRGGGVEPFYSVDENTIDTNYIFIHPENNSALIDYLLVKDA